jgi:serine/threonine-protein kinase ATR
MIGNWGDVEKTIASTTFDGPETSVAAILLAMRSGREEEVSIALTAARTRLGAPLIAAGAQSYSRSYQSLVYLHIVHDLEQTYQTSKLIHELRLDGKHQEAQIQLRALTEQVNARLDSTLPGFSTRETILSIYRIALRLVYVHVYSKSLIT